LNEAYREFFNRIAPRNRAEKIRAPLLIMRGENDPRVPVTESTQLAEVLKEQRNPVELMIFDDEGHGIAKHANKSVAYPAIVDFLKKYL
jgi:dipeptidyl aminopeptidase/acylaminoacyl peptidase